MRLKLGQTAAVGTHPSASDWATIMDIDGSLTVIAQS
jgi:hypothetical protein